MRLEPATLDPRRALQVTRYHTWPRLREQSVGEHSAQVMRILLALWPCAGRELLIHCLTHDIGETVSGDPPYPIKRLNPDLKKTMDRIEHEAHLLMATVWRVPPPVAGLSKIELAVFKLAEATEMWEWGLFEVGLGNTHAQLVVTRCVELMADCAKIVADEASGNLDAGYRALYEGILENHLWYMARRKAA